MNNDARFFFVFFGFIGFVVLGFASLAIYQKFILAVVHGVSGCMIFALGGRYLINICLKSQLNGKVQSFAKMDPANDVENVVAQTNGNALNFTKDRTNSIDEKSITSSE